MVDRPGTKAVAGIYVRVSTSDQTTDVQESELTRYARRRGWTVFKVYADKGQSGAKSRRPALDDLMSDCRRGKIDVVLVWKFDRFARSLKHLIDALEEFKGRGINFVSYTEQIDTTTAQGALFFQIFGAFAEFERALIRERVKAGLVNARSKGKRLGRPPLSEVGQEKADRLKAERAKATNGNGPSLRALARKYGVTLYQAHTICKGLEARA
jgi:DNA invertase Pin-like site-specific DNA recombinase